MPVANILVVVSSARPTRAANKVLESVKENFSGRSDVTVKIADLKEIGLPFFDEAVIPASEDFHPQNEAVKAWTQMVADADGVLFLTPEYNHSLNAIQKNAIDWIYKEWTDKPVSIIGYSWSGGSQSLKTARQVFDESQIKTVVLPTPALLRFMKEINLDGSSIDEDVVQTMVGATIDELVAAL
jgi:NAD(P)H-dependent FMN reductase